MRIGPSIEAELYLSIKAEHSVLKPCYHGWASYFPVPSGWATYTCYAMEVGLRPLINNLFV